MWFFREAKVEWRGKLHACMETSHAESILLVIIKTI